MKLLAFLTQWTRIPKAIPSLLPLAAFLSVLGGHALAVTLTPIADTYGQESSATSNFGTATTLRCENSGTSTANRDTYLKFDISSLTTIASARLRINAVLAVISTSTETFTCPISAWSVADTTWGETTLTWNNRPALGTVLNHEDVTGTMPTPVAQWIEIDVTAYLQSQKAGGQNIVSLALHNPDACLLLTTIGSRESANAPQLVVTTSVPVETDSSYYVSNTGSDTNPGTLAQPFRTIQHAASVMMGGDTCYIRAGTYRETVTPANSGTATAPITFRPYGSELVTVSGAELVTGWTVHSGGIYKASLTGALGNKDQIFVDGQMMNLARWPNTSLDISRPVKAIPAAGTYNPTVNPDGTYTGTYTDPALTQPAGFFNGAKIHLIPGAVWNAQTGTVTNYTPGSVQFTWQWNGNTSANYTPQAANPYYLFGLLSLLDSPGEWFMDAAANTLYLWPPQNDSPSSHVVEAKRRDVGFDLSGRSYIALQGLNLFACRVKSSASSQYLSFDSLSCRYISHFSLISRGNDPQEDTGVTLRGTHHTLRNSEIAFSAGDGVTLWGDHHIVENCVIHDVDYMDGEKAAVNSTRRFYSGSDLQSTSTDHEIRQNTLYNSKRSLIVAGGFRRVSVHHNRIFRSMLGTQDSGAIYTYGHSGENTEFSYNVIHDNVAIFLAAGIYLDENSSNFRLHHNLIYNSYVGQQNNLSSLNILAYNNTVSAFNYSFRTGTQTGSQAGTEVRNSILTSSFNVAVDAVASNNLLSTTDPQFVSPAALDFRIQASSPAHDAGVVLSPFTDGYEGAAPDVGALEFGQTWTAGSSLATGIPAGPTDLTATVSGSEVQLAWTDNAAGGAGFVVERSQDYKKFSALAHLPATATNYTDHTAVAGPYYYRVRAGESPYSNYPSVTIAGRDAFATTQAESFDASTGITVNTSTINSNNASNWAKYGAVNFGDGANQITLQLASSSPLTTSFLEVRLGSPTGTLIANINILSTGGASTTLTSAITPTSGVQDIYLVFKGSFFWFLDYFSFSPASPVLPPSPTAFAATSISETQLQLTWTSPTGTVDGIKVERSSDNQNFTEIGTLASSATSFTDTGLTPATIFYYRVRAYNPRGFSDYAAVASTATVPDTTPPTLSLPANITAEATSAAGRVVNFSVSATDTFDSSPTVIATPASGSTFPLGTSTVNVTATDVAGNAANGSFTVTVRDTTAPVVAAHVNVTAEATNAAGATVSYADASASDAVGVTSLTYSQNSGTIFPLGSTTVTVTAKDAANNTGTGTFTVTVQDTIAPVLSLPGNQTVEATIAAGAVVTFTVTAADAGTASPTIVATPATGSNFPVGTTTVNVTASDASGNSSSGSFTVTVRDTMAPVLTVPANITVEATSNTGAVVSFTPAATDAVGVTSLVSVPASGTGFSIGTTPVNVTATDGAGNSSSGSFTVTVRDTTAPVLMLPASPLIAGVTSPAGAVVTFTVNANDVVDGAVTATATPASGSTFPIGDTTVNVTATDSRGNGANGSFVVRVSGTLDFWFVQVFEDVTNFPMVTNLATADALIGTGARVAYGSVSQADLLGNVTGTSGGHFNVNLPVPGSGVGNRNDYAVKATARFTVEAEGDYTFAANTDEGVRVRIDGQAVIVDDALHSATDSDYVAVHLTAGVHAIEWVWFDHLGQDEAELFAAPGVHVAFGPAFKLVGDPNIFAAPTGTAPEIVVEESVGVGLTDGSATVNFGGSVAPGTITKAFTVKNTGTADLTGLGIMFDGAHSGDFIVSTPPVAPVAPGDSTTFIVRFTAGATGVRSAALHIASNDSDASTFDIALTGRSLSATDDTDGDGLNDAAEFTLSGLGFDWQVSQPALVSAFLTNNGLFTQPQYDGNFVAGVAAGEVAVIGNPNTYSLYTLSQIQDLNVDTPLIAKDPTTGKFKLTIGLKKSANLATTPFVAFPFTGPDTVINGQGKIEFGFTVPGPSAFFRLHASAQ